jgi:hypothetical protein
MTLREFIDKYYGKQNRGASICVVCKKKLTNKDEVVSDVDGNQYHQECFDKETGNEELKGKRTDNQLPYDEKK